MSFQTVGKWRWRWWRWRWKLSCLYKEAQGGFLLGTRIEAFQSFFFIPVSFQCHPVSFEDRFLVIYIRTSQGMSSMLNFREMFNQSLKSASSSRCEFDPFFCLGQLWHPNPVITPCTWLPNIQPRDCWIGGFRGLAWIIYHSQNGTWITWPNGKENSGVIFFLLQIGFGYPRSQGSSY